MIMLLKLKPVNAYRLVIYYDNYCNNEYNALEDDDYIIARCCYPVMPFNGHCDHLIPARKFFFALLRSKATLASRPGREELLLRDLVSRLVDNVMPLGRGLGPSAVWSRGYH